MKFEIKSRWGDGKVLFAAETQTLRLAVEAAVKSRVNLVGADLSGANLAGADLSRANLYVANLYRADLSGADLSRANFYGANLSGANLVGADLSGANLSVTDLSGADLSGANLIRAQGVNPYMSTPLLLLLDQPGPIRAYKLVNNKGEGPYIGGIRYEVGKSYEVADANTDPDIQLGSGIGAATLDWCIREWKKGYRILTLEFSAADIACIPTATDGKFRLTRCTVVGEKDLVQLGVVREEHPAAQAESEGPA